MNKTEVVFEPIVENCIGCNRVMFKDDNLTARDKDPTVTLTVGDLENRYCSVYLKPSSRWRVCNCPLASHMTARIESGGKKRVGQQKQKGKKQ